MGAAAPKRALRKGGKMGPKWPPVGLLRVGELEPEEEEAEEEDMDAEWGLLGGGSRGAGEPLSTFTALAAPTTPTAATGDESTDTVPPLIGVVEEDWSVGLLRAPAAAGKNDCTVSMPPPPVEINSPP